MNTTTKSSGAMGGQRDGAGRKTNKELEDRSAGLDAQAEDLAKREADMQAREEALSAKGIDPNPAPIQPLNERVVHSKGENPKAIRKEMGRAKKLDADFYVAEYPEMQIFWVNDMDGDVQRWINAGANPVPVTRNSNRSFEGITDKLESKWVRAVGGSDGMGAYYWVYLMMIARARYYELEIAPVVERQDAMRAAMSRGQDQSKLSKSEAGIETYAPNLPTGGRGLQKVTDHMTGRN